ncbi:hypothetical protein [Ensifer sp. SL37]|uniref:hypothetical protein n=1 Tax=Ensifer sp. SL37 TaxID=2995137 RepID=UPI0022737BB4|nr:hypothetical protein [Ensifer sp. SL37]MCY1741177.1 hypothetical protein [Ensifer sp. SL37]
MTGSFSSYAQMAEEAEKYCVELRGWLDTFSSGPKKWPDHNIANKRKRLEWAEKCRDIFERGAKRDEAAA